MSTTDSSSSAGSSSSSSALQVLVHPATSEKEVEKWGIFCATRGFAHRPGPVERFYRKYLNDPTRRLDWVIIAYQSNGNGTSTGTDRPGDGDFSSVPNTVTEHAKVSSSSSLIDTSSLPVIGSVRLFDRTVYVNDSVGSSSSSLLPSFSSSSSSPVSRSVSMIGWGEVCTEPQLRGKGIANHVLGYAIQTMEQYHQQHPEYTVSLLHAATTVMPLYEKFGYRSILLRHGSIPLLGSLTVPLPLPLTNETIPQIPLTFPLATGPNLHRKLRVRLARIPSSRTNSSSSSSSTIEDEDDVPSLMEIYRDTIHSLSASWKTGTIERNEEYWRTWIPFAARGQLWVLEEDNEEEKVGNHNPLIIGYACAHWRNDTLRLMDIGFRQPDNTLVIHDNYQRQKDIIYLLENAYTQGWGSERYVAAAAVQAAAVLASSVGGNTTVTVPSLRSSEQQYLTSTNLIIPSPILAWFTPLFSTDSLSVVPKFVPDLPNEIDPGWMVRSLSPTDNKDTDILRQSGNEGTFCILGLDGF